jgi:hypothetical protein
MLLLTSSTEPASLCGMTTAAADKGSLLIVRAPRALLFESFPAYLARCAAMDPLTE